MKMTFLKIISYFRIQESQIGGKMDQFGGKKKFNPTKFMEFVFSKSLPKWKLQIKFFSGE